MARRGPVHPAFAAERQEEILRRLAEHGRVRVVDLAGELGVAEPTVRKDIIDLADRGLLRRTYGGAITVTAPPEPTIATRSARHVQAKQRLAELAIGLIEPGESVYLDNGTTVLALASAMAAAPAGGRWNVNLLTNGVEVAQTMADVPGVRHVLLGGTYRSAGNALTGPLTLDALAQFAISTAFIGVSGLADGWLSVADLAEAQVKGAVIGKAGRVVVLMDASKFGVSDFARVCRLESVTTLITDRIDEAQAELARQAGVEILTP